MSKPLPKKPKTFEEFYKIKQKHAKHLTKTYQKQLKKKVRLSVNFNDFGVAKKEGKVKMTLWIRANDLREEHFLEDNDPEANVKLNDWPASIHSSDSNNKIHFLKGKDIPKPLYTRIHKVEKNPGAFSENSDGKLVIKNGSNRYVYIDHTVYLAEIDKIKAGTYYDVITHEFDHVARIREKNITAYEQVKSEIFAFHAQMLTLINEGIIGQDRKDRSVKLRGLDSYTVIYKYLPELNDQNERLKKFIKIVLGEGSSKPAWHKLIQITAFIKMIYDDPNTFHDIDDVLGESLDIRDSNEAYTVYMTYKLKS